MLPEKWEGERYFCPVFFQILFDVIPYFAGLNVGCFYAVGTLLNRMIIVHYPVCMFPLHSSPIISVACNSSDTATDE